MALTNLNYNPNARYDNGPACAGSGRVSIQSVLTLPARETGLGTNGVLGDANSRVGFSAAGVSRANSGPNVAGAPRSINGT